MLRRRTKTFVIVFIFCLLFVHLVSLYHYTSKSLPLPFTFLPSFLSLKEVSISPDVKEKTLLDESWKHPSRLLGSPLLKKLTDTTTSNISENSSIGVTGNWKEGTFCHRFLVNTFEMPIPVCANTTKVSSRSSVKCFGSQYSNHMSTCILENVVVSPHLLAKAMLDADHTKFTGSESSISLLDDRNTECHNISVVHLRKQVESGDYVWQLVDKLKQGEPQNSSVCEKWIEDDVFFFTAHRFHIYFRFLDYFNVHKMLQDFKHTLSSRYHIIKISGSDNYHFSDFDQMLFPEVNVQSIDHLDNVRTCFKKVILVPKSYASVLYQCKMPYNIRHKCMDCNGQGLTNTQISMFRKRVLKACFLSDNAKHDGNSSIIFVSRKQYLRNNNDRKDNFERVMDNEEGLRLALQTTFNSSTVLKVHFEDLGLCEQIRIVHNADIYLGVHGAGLVHLWWLKDNSLVYEMEPHYEIGNPTFRMLARLSGHKYRSSSIGGGWNTVHAHISEIIKDLDRYSSLSKGEKVGGIWNEANHHENPKIDISSALLNFPNKLIRL